VSRLDSGVPAGLRCPGWTPVSRLDSGVPVGLRCPGWTPVSRLDSGVPVGLRWPGWLEAGGGACRPVAGRHFHTRRIREGKGDLSLPETLPFPPCRPRIGGRRETRVTHVPIDVAHVVNGLAHAREQVVQREGDGLGEAVDVPVGRTWSPAGICDFQDVSTPREVVDSRASQLLELFARRVGGWTPVGSGAADDVSLRRRRRCCFLWPLHEDEGESRPEGERERERERERG
jgi:hypothetical protein